MRPNYRLCSAAGSFLELLSNGNSCFKGYFIAEGLQVEAYKVGSATAVFALTLALEAMSCVSIR